MRCLLDTHTILWVAIGSSRQSDPVRKLLGESGHDFFVSAASTFELATKHRLGKLPEAAEMLKDFEKEIELSGIRLLSISSLHARTAAAFPQTHKDPFDRILAAQALLERLTLVSADAQLDTFGIDRFW